MNKKELPIPFKIVKVEENQFSVFEETLVLEEPIQQQIGFGFGIDAESRIVVVSMEFVLHKQNQPLIKLEIACYFEIEPQKFQEKLVQADGVVLPCSLTKHLAMITMGTARGVLFANTKNTEFNKFIIGLVNVDKMFTEDVHIEY
ncbi:MULTISPECIES: hypothetical protein [Empedobacter]|uniref:hypothetical protein n=1 Tax=Empedobacter TaxID=59734 RepID=UPI0025772B84|nr:MULTISPECIES: hypothetical protein [Empedobacter]MDM1041685.1 hypothetical protein [Empedobacter brevis]MDM1135181.1 hypothetical protein [Empedobacter sp. R750]